MNHGINECSLVFSASIFRPDSAEVGCSLTHTLTHVVLQLQGKRDCHTLPIPGIPGSLPWESIEGSNVGMFLTRLDFNDFYYATPFPSTLLFPSLRTPASCMLMAREISSRVAFVHYNCRCIIMQFFRAYRIRI